MMLISSLRPHWASCLLALLSATVLTVFATAPASAANTEAGAQTLEAVYTLPGKPSELLRAPQSTWAPLLQQVDAALNQRANALDLLSQPARAEFYVHRTVVEQTRKEWPAVLEAVKQARQQQGTVVGQQLSGLLNEIVARQAQAGGDAAWLRLHLRDQVLAMPWAEVEPTILSLRQQLGGMTSEVIETHVTNKLDVSAGITSNKVSLSFVMQLLAMRFQLLEVVPRKDALIVGLDEAIAQRKDTAAGAAAK